MKAGLFAFLVPETIIFGKTTTMKAIFKPLFLLLIVISACKGEKKTDTTDQQTEEPGILEKVALAHGYDHWDAVEELRFTFNVDRDTSHFERSWIWKPKLGEVTLMVSGDTLTYNRKEVDSTLAGHDASFINDKYWFLVPYQLVWDSKSFTYEVTEEIPSPVAGTPMQKLTIVYGNEGGYTPGDAYDLYLDENFVVREWTFRRGNKPAPGSDATWEGYETYEGLQVSTMHQLGGGAKLYFTGVKVNTK